MTFSDAWKEAQDQGFVNGDESGQRSYIPRMPSANGHNGSGGGPVPPIDLTEDLPPAPRDFVLDCLYQQEYGDALLLAYLYQGRLVYDHAQGKWYEWGAHFWKPDQTAKVRRIIAGQLAAQYLILSAELGKELEAAEEEGDGEKNDTTKLKGHIKQLRDRANQLKQLRRIDRILSFAASFLGIVGNEWDNKPGVIACPNGVVDLRTGELSPGNPADYLRASCPTEWQGMDAPAPRFQQFVREIFDETGDAEPELSNFLQMVIGYGTTGTVKEHLLLIFYGPRGRNGKDTLLETLGFVLGDTIAGACSQDVFITQERKNAAGSPREDLYGLLGKRLVWASESDEHAKLNTNQVKLITGGGQITCRPLRGHQVSFMPTHMPILLTNFKPRVPDHDDAFWERVHLLPFTLRFVDDPQGATERQKDPHLQEKLRQEAPGILAWIVRGSIAWYLAGRLNAPESVKLATQEYKDEMNPLAEFLHDRCVFAETAEITNPDLWKAYQAWAEENEVSRPLGRKTFTQRIERLEGVTKRYTTDKKTRLWKGIDVAKSGTL